jgi:predicted nucleic acid-binding protein
LILLDTDIMIDVLRNYPPAVHWMQSLSDEVIALPGFVVMELIQGCETKRELTKLRKKLLPFNIYWLTTDDCNRAVEIFSQYYLSHQIGIIDAMIGQLAVSLQIPLYSFNKKHYSPITGLQIIQPYQKG